MPSVPSERAVVRTKKIQPASSTSPLNTTSGAKFSHCAIAHSTKLKRVGFQVRADEHERE